MGIDREVALPVLGILGNIASGFFFLSSVPTIVGMIRSKSVGGISGDLYVFKLFNCMLWSLYGLPFVHPHDMWVVITNSFGGACSITYIIPYLCFATRKQRLSVMLKLVVILSCFMITVVLLFTLELSRQNRITVVGILSAVVSSVMHMALLFQTKLALKSRELKYLHPNSAVAGFFKGAIWTGYGVVNFDIYIVVPNGIGVAIGIIQLLLAMMLHLMGTKDPSPIEDGEGKASKRNSMEMSKRNSMETSKRISMEMSKRISMEGSKRSSMELRRRSSTEIVRGSEDEVEQLAAFSLSLQGMRSAFERQAGISAVVVPIDVIGAGDGHNSAELRNSTEPKP